MKAADGATIKPSTRIKKPSDENKGCKVSSLWLKDFSQLTQPPYNSFSVQRRLVSARTQQAIRAAAMTVWREAVAVAFETQNSFF
jgi:hypothetical protein